MPSGTYISLFLPLSPRILRADYTHDRRLLLRLLCNGAGLRFLLVPAASAADAEAGGRCGGDGGRTSRAGAAEISLASQDMIWARFHRLPARYALDVNVERAEDVVTHQQLHEARDPQRRPALRWASFRVLMLYMMLSQILN